MREICITVLVIIIFLQVHVTIGGQLAACAGGLSASDFLSIDSDICAFEFAQSATPNVTSISTEMANAGGSIVINGDGFSDSPEDNFVLFGDVECNVTSSSSTSIGCVLRHGLAGMKKLYLHVIPAGLANTNDLLLEYGIAVDSIQPNISGLMGGLAVVVKGSGFAASDKILGSHPMSHKGYSFHKHLEAAQTECSGWETSVFIGSNKCHITSVTVEEIACIVSSGAVGSSDVHVSISCISGSSEVYTGTLSNGFTHDAYLTPTIAGVSPMQGHGSGGEVVTITGSGFSDINSENTVMVS